jgi:hypothetical protein
VITTLLDWLYFKISAWLMAQYARRRARALAARRQTIQARITVDDQATPVLEQLRARLRELQVHTIDPRTEMPSQIATVLRIHVETDPPRTYSPVIHSVDAPRTVTVPVGDQTALEHP